MPVIQPQVTGWTRCRPWQELGPCRCQAALPPLSAASAAPQPQEPLASEASLAQTLH